MFSLCNYRNRFLDKVINPEVINFLLQREPIGSEDIVSFVGNCKAGNKEQKPGKTFWEN